MIYRKNYAQDGHIAKIVIKSGKNNNSRIKNNIGIPDFLGQILL